MKRMTTAITQHGAAGNERTQHECIYCALCLFVRIINRGHRIILWGFYGRAAGPHYICSEHAMSPACMAASLHTALSCHGT